MRLRSLNQLVEVTRALARPDHIVIIGSSSLLPAHPDLGEPGHPLETSYDSDLLISPIDDELAAVQQLVDAPRAVLHLKSSPTPHRRRPSCRLARRALLC